MWRSIEIDFIMWKRLHPFLSLLPKKICDFCLWSSKLRNSTDDTDNNMITTWHMTHCSPGTRPWPWGRRPTPRPSPPWPASPCTTGSTTRAIRATRASPCTTPAATTMISTLLLCYMTVSDTLVNFRAGYQVHVSTSVLFCIYCLSTILIKLILWKMSTISVKHVCCLIMLHLLKPVIFYILYLRRTIM